MRRVLFSTGLLLAHMLAPWPVALAQHIEVKDTRTISADELRLAAESSSFEVTLPSGKLVSFPNVTVAENAGVRTLRSRDAAAELLLTTDGNRGFGYVIFDNRKYDINTQGGVTRIFDSMAAGSELAVPYGIGDDVVINNEMIARLIEQQVALDPAVASSQTDNVIRIAFFYDPAIAEEEGSQSPRTVAQAAVDFANAAFEAHSVSVILEIAYVGALTTDLNGEDPWSHFWSNGDRRTIAGFYGADLMHYLYYYDGESYCGRAELPGRLGVSALYTRSFPCFMDTFAHEIGHNLGMHHDRDNADFLSLPYSDYNYGYVCGNSGTLMAYFWPRLSHFSTPRLQNNGENCGVDIGDPLAAYNGAVLQITAPTTASIEPDQVPIGNVWMSPVGLVQVSEETAAPIEITVMRDGNLNLTSSVEIGAIEREAEAGSDFVDFVERIDFAAGESSKTVFVEVRDDELYEPDVETFDIVIRYPHRLNVIDDSLVVEITSDDPDRGIASLPVRQFSVWEDHGVLEIPVERTEPFDHELTVQVEIDPVTAVAGVDFVDVSDTVTIPAGMQAASIDVPIIDDDLFDGTGVLRFDTYLVGDNVDVSSDVSYVLILNDDLLLGQGRFTSDTFYAIENRGNVTFSVERINGTESTYDYCVLFNEDGTAISGIDYLGGGTSDCGSMNPGVASRLIKHAIYDNDEADGEKYFFVNFESDNETVEPASARVIIIDDDSANAGGGSVQVAETDVDVHESVGSVALTVTRTGGSAGSATFSYTTDSDTAIEGDDFGGVSGTLFWADGDTQPKSVAVPIADDLEQEEDEFFSFVIYDVYGATQGSEVRTDIRISSNDDPGTIAVADVLVPISEGETSTIEVSRLDGTRGAISVQYDTVSGSAEADEDFVPVAGVLDWVDGDGSSRMIEIVSIDDALTESGEALSLRLSNPTGGAGLGASETTITIADNDGIALPYMLSVADVSNDQVRDLAVIRDGPTVSVEIRSGANSAPLGVVEYFDAFAATFVDAVSMPDIDGDGVPELAILATRNSDGRMVAEVRNLAGDPMKRYVWFAKDHTPIAIRVVKRDADGNGVPEIAVLSTRNSDGRIVVEVKNAMGATNTNTLWFMNNNTPVDMEIVEDRNSGDVPRVAVLSSRNSDGRSVVELKNAAGPTSRSTVWFLKDAAAVDLLPVEDKDGNGIPEIAVLSSRDSDSRNVVEIKNVVGPSMPATVWFTPGNTALALGRVRDADGNGVQEIAVLSERDADGRISVERKNMTGPTSPHTLWYSKGFTPRGLKILADLDGNGIEDSFVLMVRDSDARILIEGRNLSGSARPDHYWFSP